MLEYVRPSRTFEKDKRELKKDYPRIDEVCAAAARELVRAPQTGEQYQHHQLGTVYLFLTTPIGYMPVFRILYRIIDEPRPIIVLLRIGRSSRESDIPF